MTAEDRVRRTAVADALCAKAYEQSGGPDSGAALVAVGGYGHGAVQIWTEDGHLLATASQSASMFEIQLERLGQPRH